MRTKIISLENKQIYRNRIVSTEKLNYIEESPKIIATYIDENEKENECKQRETEVENKNN